MALAHKNEPDPFSPVCNLTFASKEARDGAVSTGMTDGMEHSYTRLDGVFEVAA